MKIYEIKVKLGYNTDNGYGTQFDIISHATGNKPYKLIIHGILHGLINKKFIQGAGYDVLVEIDGILIPSDYQFSDKTIEEVYTSSLDVNIRDLGVDSVLTNALTKAINEVIKERKNDEK